MTTLQSRKKLLLAESELNRVHMVAEARLLRTDFRRASDRARSLGARLGSGALLVAGWVARRRSPPAGATGKATWFQRLLKGVGLLATLWTAFGRSAREPAGSESAGRAP